LRYAADVVDRLRERDREGTQAALDGLSAPDEVDGWRRVGASMYYPPSSPSGVIQQHEGYFALPDQTVDGFDANGRPVLAESDRRAADRLESFSTRLVKEADVVLLLALFRSKFEERVRRASYDFYVARTVQESSLSAAPHGVVAAELGELEDAHRFLLLSGRYDLDFIPRSGYRNGLHLAAYAGAWQVAIQGFGGFAVRDGEPALDPCLPPDWTKLTFGIWWRGQRVRVHVTAEDVAVEYDRGNPKAQTWWVRGERRTVSP
jgi:trehalose/maltose hydrolase-like predicted phosphorylase